MKRVLILAYYFPPIAASGSMRPVGFCNHLMENGYYPHVLTTDWRDAHPPVAIDPSLENLIPDGVRIDRLSHVNLLKELLELRSRFRSKVHGGGHGDSPEVPVDATPPSPIKRLKRDMMNRLFLFPDHQKPWIHAVNRHVKGLGRQERPDLVFATGNPWSALIAGQQVARYLSVPFVADFRDPWSQNPKPPLSDSLGRKAVVWERKILKDADCVVANTRELADAFAQEVPESSNKIVTITNGYHDGIFPDGRIAEQSRVADAKIELSHFGSVYELRSPIKLLQAIQQLWKAGVVTKEDIRVRFIGAWIVEDVACNRLAAELETAGLITREPPVAHDAYLNRLAAAQNLLILQQAFPLQIPGKIYEYIASGRPMIIVGGEGATANLVARHRLGLTFPNSIDQLAEGLRDLVEGKITVSCPGNDEIHRFSYGELTRQLAGVFDHLLLEKT